jgi:hypothetical protein
MIRGGETAADVENLNLVAARLRLLHHAGGDVQRLDEVLEIHALAADVEAQSLHHQAQVEGLLNQRPPPRWVGPEFG